jgi:hypothetical protein
MNWRRKVKTQTRLAAVANSATIASACAGVRVTAAVKEVAAGARSVGTSWLSCRMIGPGSLQMWMACGCPTSPTNWQAEGQGIDFPGGGPPKAADPM